jgi:hypothetical protein
VTVEPDEQKTRPIIGEGDESDKTWKLRHCTEMNLTAQELAILCACWYVRKKTVADSTKFIPPELFQFQEDLLIPLGRRRERIEIRHPLPLLEKAIQVLTKEDFLKNPDQHAKTLPEAEKRYIRQCCARTIETGLPALYRIKETQRFQLFSSLIWAFYAAKIESSEIQEEEADSIPEDIISAQAVYRENFNLPHHRFVAARQINNEARRILNAIRDETAALLPTKEAARWRGKTEQQINDEVFRTRQAVLKGYITKEDADQLKEVEDAERRVEEKARKKKLKPDTEEEYTDAGEIPDDKWQTT